MKRAKPATFYDRDYYLRGIETGKSCYENYRWLPELTMPMVMRMIDYLHIRPDQTILDFGCAFGYVVKAFRLLHREAWGFDISPYAIQHVDELVKPYCFLPNKPVEIPESFDFCIAKDVLEHIDYQCIKSVLKNINAKHIFAIIPLGNGDGKYIAPSNNLDKSHIICEDINWWLDTFYTSCWELIHFGYRIDGIKDSYYKNYPRAHGFFFTRRRF